MVENVRCLERRKGLGRIDAILKLQQKILQPYRKRNAGVCVNWLEWR
jgi:hypothetical protein